MVLDNDIVIRTISNPDIIKKIDNEWNRLVNLCSTNPYNLSSFIRDRMGFYKKNGWDPQILIMTKHNELVGSIPIRIKNELGFRYAKFLIEPDLSPDFITLDECREICIAKSLEYLFKQQRLIFLDFTLQSESPNLPFLKKICRAYNIHTQEIIMNGHSVIPIKCSWNEFKKTRKKKLKEFKYLENKLTKAGSWKIISFKNAEIDSNIYKVIFNIEKMSWKQHWRNKRGIIFDESLHMMWNVSNEIDRTSLDYNWYIYFLVLNDKFISYALMIQYKSLAILMKTSYDNRYREFSPGKFVINASIQDQFNNIRIKNIDFLTDIPVTGIWSSMVLPRVRFLMSYNRILPEILDYVLRARTRYSAYKNTVFVARTQ